MEEEKFISIVLVYVLCNVILFIVYKLTHTVKILHRILSIIDNMLFAALLGYGFYRMNPLLVILVPCVLLIVYPISWGLNEELSDEDVADLVILKCPIPIGEKNRKNLKLTFAHFGTFPFYYLLDSWKKTPEQ